MARSVHRLKLRVLQRLPGSGKRELMNADQRLLAHARDQMRLVGDKADVLLHLFGRWPDHNMRRLVSGHPTSPQGEVVGKHPRTGVYVLFSAAEVLAYVQRWPDSVRATVVKKSWFK